MGITPSVIAFITTVQYYAPGPRASLGLAPAAADKVMNGSLACALGLKARWFHRLAVRTRVVPQDYSLVEASLRSGIIQRLLKNKDAPSTPGAAKLGLLFGISNKQFNKVTYTDGYCDGGTACFQVDSLQYWKV